ncbi:MAG: T9SS type A sorting domain-containing protein [Calditrichales bacterium]|nr:T9SS type A sorting domain-containing protein [Calditrichales bacterium]
MFRQTIKILLLVLFISAPAEHSILASTIGIATGNKTIDGRPLLFKTKDRKDNYPSDVDYYPGNSSYYAYVFQKNIGNDHTRARMGINTTGFGIVYSTSENLSGMGFGSSGSEFAALALKKCNSIQQFRNLLSETAGNRDVHEHYAVIDSSGAGSLFEVDGETHIEILIVDSIGAMANTSKYHPNAGPPASGSTSPEREARVTYLQKNCPLQGLDYRYFLNEIMKDFCTTQSDEDKMPDGQYKTNAVISRYKTAAACVIKGCKLDDNPMVETVMWLSLGEPSFSLALPFFADASQILPEIQAEAAGDGMAGSIDRMRKLIYDYSGGRYADLYADTDVLVDIRLETFSLQDTMSASYDRLLPVWRETDDIQRQEDMQAWSLQMQDFGKTKYDSLYSEITFLEGEPDNYLTPDSYVLSQNYPNPFNGCTRIDVRFSIRPASISDLTIYDIQGQKVCSIKPNFTTAGRYSFLWDGINDFGVQVGSGIYVYQIQMDESVLSKKLILLR